MANSPWTLCVSCSFANTHYVEMSKHVLYFSIIRLYIPMLFSCFLFRQASRDQKDLKAVIRKHRERNTTLARFNNELNQELQEVMEQRIALEIQLEHLRPFSTWRPSEELVQCDAMWSLTVLPPRPVHIVPARWHSGGGHPQQCYLQCLG